MPKKSVIPAALMAVLAGAWFVAACNDAPSPTAPPPPAENVAAAPAGASLVAGAPGYAPQAGDPSVGSQPVLVLESKKGAGGCGGKKVAVCHVPPGNSANVHEICISENAVPAHEAHGDYIPLTFWPDQDGDSFGDASASGGSGCIVPLGSVEDNSDCDDNDAAINPEAQDICDGVDNDCSGTVDDGIEAQPTVCGVGECTAEGELTCESGALVDSCLPNLPSGEICDGLDNNCNGTVDDGGNNWCDNGLYCDGSETCANGACWAGLPVPDGEQCNDAPGPAECQSGVCTSIAICTFDPFAYQGTRNPSQFIQDCERNANCEYPDLCEQEGSVDNECWFCVQTLDGPHCYLCAFYLSNHCTGVCPPNH